MKKILKSFSDKKFRYGAFSTLISVVVILTLAAANLVVSLFDVNFDLTLDKRYSISKESKKILSEVAEDVTIYALFKTGGGNLQYETLLNEYAQASNHITVVYKDPYLYPTFVEAYKTDAAESIPVDSIIVESAKRFKVIRADELYTLGFDYESYQQYVKSMDIEPRVTNAVRYVSQDNTPKIYQITNHSEVPIPETMQKQITMANYEVFPLNIFEEDIPEDTDILMLTTPVRDYSPGEAQKVKDYLSSGGRALILYDAAQTPAANFLSIMQAYCVTHNNDFIFEGSRANYMGTYQYLLLPDKAAHDITNNLPANTYVVSISSSGLSPSSAVRNSIKIEPILVTSKQSYAKTGETESTNKEANDASGPFDIAVAVTDSVYMPETVITKLVITGSSSFLYEDMNTYVAGGNGDFLLSCFNWLNDRDDTVYILPKTNFTLENLVINSSQGNILALSAMFGLPGGILACGVIVWARRRNR